MRAPTQPTVIILASGRGERFRASGGTVHKLQALLAGRPVLQHVLDAVRSSGLPWHLEDAGHPGMGDSIAAALRAVPDAAGWLILPADLPLVRTETLQRVAAMLVEQDDVDAVQPTYGGERGHPVAFSARCRDALLRLSGSQGAAPVIKMLRVEGRTLDVEVDDIGVVTDVDTVDDLARAERLISAWR